MKNLIYDTPAKNTAGTFPRKSAEKLFTFLKKRESTTKIRYTRNWANEFAALQNSGIPEARISAALKFYLANHRKPFVPLIFSASGFRKKFLQIEAAAARTPPEKIIVSQTARDILRHCGNPVWPDKKTTAAAPEFVQISLDRYLQFLKTLENIWISAAAGAELIDREQIAKTGYVKSDTWEWANLLQYALNTAPDPAEFIADWVRCICAVANAAPEWDGNLTRYAWGPYTRSWGVRMRATCRAYNGEPGAWDKIQKLIADNPARG